MGQVVEGQFGKALRSLSYLVNYVQQAWQVSLSHDTLARWMRANRYRYKRMRRSVKHRRDAERFEQARQQLAILHEQEAQGRLDVFYMDQTGVALTPVVPYAWQPIGQQIPLASQPSQNLTVVGLMNKACRFHSFRFEGAATAKVIVRCMEEFIETITKPTVVVLDNASIHTAKIVQAKREAWNQKGVTLYFIPPYSPELNLIERLWLELKYRWLDHPGYFESITELRTALDETLALIGTKYRITFD